MGPAPCLQARLQEIHLNFSRVSDIIDHVLEYYRVDWLISNILLYTCDEKNGREQL